MKSKRREFFSETVLVVLVSVVTLLLQLISFATTWSGSGIYLEGVFPYASLLFAVAIQATAYFFSNSLRNKVTFLKVTAMLLAMCCSTYYSYIGIYNSVNSPLTFLQERYVQIEKELTDIYRDRQEEAIVVIKDAVSEAATTVIREYSLLAKEREKLVACGEALAQEGESHADNIRVPKQWEYETYEEYAAAYQVYVQAISAGSNAEEEAGRLGILASYGFASVEQMQLEEAENKADMTTLLTTLGMPEEELTTGVSDICVRTIASLDKVLEGQDIGTANYVDLNRLMRAASLYETKTVSGAEIATMVKETMSYGTSLMSNYEGLVAMLEGGRVTIANVMELKGLMDSEILKACLRLHLQEEADSKYAITDLYLVPIEAIQNESTRMTALFCLGMAALVDGLSLLFAVSLKERKTLWNRHSLLWVRWEDYTGQIHATLPGNGDGAEELSNFLERFQPSPETEKEGYMMLAFMADLEGYGRLTALLCQLNLAKIMPGDFCGKEGDIVLLKAKFVFWCNSVINETREEKRERIIYE